MKIKSKKLSKKAVIIIAVIVLLAGLSTAGAYYYFNQQNAKEDKADTSSKENKPATKEQKESGEAIKDQSVNANEPQPTKPNATPPENTPAPPQNAGVQIDITAASQNNSTGMYQLRAIIHSIQGEGTCRLTLTKGGAQVIKEVSVQPLPSSSTCRGFDIPLSELSAGQWQAHLTFSNTRVSGTTSKTITIQ